MIPIPMQDDEFRGVGVLGSSRLTLDAKLACGTYWATRSDHNYVSQALALSAS